MKRVGVFNRGLRRMPMLGAFLQAEVVPCWWWPRGALDATAGWGRSRHTRRARQIAADRGLPFLALEDGFLRSFQPGRQCPPLSLVLDDIGIHYDSTRPSALERLLASGEDLLGGGAAQDAARARALILEHGLSKYNHAPPMAQVQAVLGRPLLRPDDVQRVLVVDQTRGDLSIALGGASEHTFTDLLAAALANNPRATVYVKTHPQALAGRRQGHYTRLHDGERLVVLRQAIEPLSLLRHMDAVYVVSSTLGFEALLAGRPVFCFGMPWYAGWGATRDRQRCERRTRARSVDELFVAAYLRYARYLNPETHAPGTVFDAIDWLARQRRLAGFLPERHRG